MIEINKNHRLMTCISSSYGGITFQALKQGFFVPGIYFPEASISGNTQ